jgi:hypothetical protein
VIEEMKANKQAEKKAEENAAPDLLAKMKAVQIKHPLGKRKAHAKTAPAKKEEVTDAAKEAAEKPVKAEKVRKPKLVRRKLMLLKVELAQLGILKERALAFAADPRRNELLRAGLLHLASLGEEEFKAAVTKFQRIRKVRKKNKKGKKK